MSSRGARDALEVIYRSEARRVLATLVRLLRSFDAAEEGLHEAFVAAAETWPREGVPANPYAWLVSAGRFKMINRWRRQARLAAVTPELLARAVAAVWLRFRFHPDASGPSTHSGWPADLGSPDWPSR